MKQLPDGVDPMSLPETWGELFDALVAAGFGQDEYLNAQSAAHSMTFEQFRAKPLWADDTWRLICFWVKGGSEGYFAHIEEIRRDGVCRCYICGKFWSWERAQECANYAARLLNW